MKSQKLLPPFLAFFRHGLSVICIGWHESGSPRFKLLSISCFPVVGSHSFQIPFLYLQSEKGVQLYMYKSMKFLPPQKKQMSPCSGKMGLIASL